MATIASLVEQVTEGDVARAEVTPDAYLVAPPNHAGPPPLDLDSLGLLDLALMLEERFDVAPDVIADAIETGRGLTVVQLCDLVLAREVDRFSDSPGP